MEIMVSMHTMCNLQQLKDWNVTHIMISDESFSSGAKGLSRQAMAKAIEEIHFVGLKAIIRVDRLYEQREIEALKEYLTFVDCSGADGVLFSDVTIKVLVDKLGLKLESIYAPETLLTNKYDVAALKNDSFYSCVISKDIPLDDVYEIAEYNPDYCFVRVHGSILISYSKRRFISVYLNDYKQYMDNYFLQEENRSVKLPIVEKNNGSWVYGYTLESFEEIANIIKKPFKGIIIDNMLNDDEYTLQCVKLYNEVIEKQTEPLTALDELKKMDESIEYTSINDIKKTFLEKE